MSDVWENDICTYTDDSHFSLKPRKMVFVFLPNFRNLIDSINLRNETFNNSYSNKGGNCKVLYVLYMLIKK